MYGLPDSFIVGTARRVIRSLRIKGAQSEFETGWGRLMGEFLEWLDKRAKQKRAKKKLSKKHNLDFS